MPLRAKGTNEPRLALIAHRTPIYGDTRADESRRWKRCLNSVATYRATTDRRTHHGRPGKDRPRSRRRIQRQ
jgi:hypothetical protein